MPGLAKAFEEAVEQKTGVSNYALGWDVTQELIDDQMGLPHKKLDLMALGLLDLSQADQYVPSQGGVLVPPEVAQDQYMGEMLKYKVTTHPPPPLTNEEAAQFAAIMQQAPQPAPIKPAVADPDDASKLYPGKVMFANDDLYGKPLQGKHFDYIVADDIPKGSIVGQEMLKEAQEDIDKKINKMMKYAAEYGMGAALSNTEQMKSYLGIGKDNLAKDSQIQVLKAMLASFLVGREDCKLEISLDMVKDAIKEYPVKLLYYPNDQTYVAALE